MGEGPLTLLENHLLADICSEVQVSYLLHADSYLYCRRWRSHTHIRQAVAEAKPPREHQDADMLISPSQASDVYILIGDRRNIHIAYTVTRIYMAGGGESEAPARGVPLRARSPGPTLDFSTSNWIQQLEPFTT